VGFVPKIRLPQAFSSEKALTPTKNLNSIARMNAKTLGLALTVSFLATAACFAANPQMETWQLDDAKSKLAPGMGKSTTVIYTQKGGQDSSECGWRR
jgi:hypothetical protein